MPTRVHFFSAGDCDPKVGHTDLVFGVRSGFISGQPGVPTQSHKSPWLRLWQYHCDGRPDASCIANCQLFWPLYEMLPGGPAADRNDWRRRWDRDTRQGQTMRRTYAHSCRDTGRLTAERKLISWSIKVLRAQP